MCPNSQFAANTKRADADTTSAARAVVVRRRGDHFIVLCEPETHPPGALNTTGQDAGSSTPGASGRRLRGGHVETRHVESWRAFESLRRPSRGIDAPNWFRP